MHLRPTWVYPCGTVQVMIYDEKSQLGPFEGKITRIPFAMSFGRVVC